MKISQVRAELADRLARIDGLRVFRYVPKTISPPAAVVGWPEPVDYDGTLGRGMDSLTVPVLVAVSDLHAESASDAVDAYLDGHGPRSVKAVLDGGDYGACDAVIVSEARVEPISVAGIPYLAAIFDVAVTGQGKG
jgi:hypothetical protein